MDTRPTKTLMQALIGLALSLGALAAYAVVLYYTLIAIASVANAGMPPSRYDRPYDGYLVDIRVPLGKAHAACNSLAAKLGEPQTHPMRVAGRPLYGCAYVLHDGGLCFVVYSYDPSGRDRHMERNVKRHELAHCNGWPAHHPDQR